MKSTRRHDARPPEGSNDTSRVFWTIVIACVVVIVAALLLPRPKAGSAGHAAATNSNSLAQDPGPAPRSPSAARRWNPVPEPAPVKTAEEIVADKVSQFGRDRRDLVRAIGRRLNKEVPAEVERFFDALAAGQWEEINAQFRELARRSGQYDYSTTNSPELGPFWSAVLDAYGVAEQAHLWPAQKLLDYGNSVLGSLRPGMVYVGGTDNGRWIPELLDATSGAEPHVIVTQNALADSRYLEFLTTLYGDRVATLTPEDSQHAFEEYLADARKRLQHDQQFPDEPKQIRPGENVLDAEGRVQVSGQTAVMQVNENLLQKFMQKNPDLSFALQESFPMKGVYADAVPLGPLMELRAPDAQTAFTADNASQAVDYWRAAAANLLAEPDAAASPTALKSYSHDAASTANLLAAHNFNADAEQAYRLASQLWPENADAVGGLAGILQRSGHADQARQLLDDFVRNHPEQRPAIETFRGSILLTAPSAKTAP